MTTIVLFCISFIWGYIGFTITFAVLHLIFGLILGYKFVSFYLFFINFKMENGRFKISVGDFQLSAVCHMSKLKTSARDTVLYNLLPAVFGLASGILLWKMCYVMGLSFMWKCSIGLYTCFFVATLLLSFSMVYNCTSNNPKAVMWRRTNFVINSINAGIRPGETDIDIIDIPDKKLPDISDIRYYLMLYYYYLDNLNYDKMAAIARLFEINMPQAHNRYYIPYMYELVFYYSYIEPDIEKAGEYFSYIDTEIMSDKEVNGRRVYAYYLYYTHKGRDKALQVAKEGLACADLFIHKGLAVMEKDLLNDIIKEIEGKM